MQVGQLSVIGPGPKRIDHGGGARSQIRMSKAKGHAIVTWWYTSPRIGAYTAGIDVRTCKYTFKPVAWKGNDGGQCSGCSYTYDTAIDNAGRFFLFGKMNDKVMGVRIHKADGTLEKFLQTPLDMQCEGSGYGMHIAVSATTGAGVVTCQKHASNPITAAKFSSKGTWVKVHVRATHVWTWRYTLLLHPLDASAPAAFHPSVVCGLNKCSTSWWTAHKVAIRRGTSRTSSA